MQPSSTSAHQPWRTGASKELLSDSAMLWTPSSSISGSASVPSRWGVKKALEDSGAWIRLPR